MASAPFRFPQVPSPLASFIPYLDANPEKPLRHLLAPYTELERKLREAFAQHKDLPALQDPYVNAVPIFDGHEGTLRVRARSLDDEAENARYIMPLSGADRKRHGAPAIVNSLQDFKHNFNLFSESSLVDLDWDNVVVAGSAVVTAMLPVPSQHDGSKRALRHYYHQKLAPSSDVDLFLWGLDEAAAVEKIKSIEERVRNSILAETTTIRTKNAVTIASQYPTRHIQIVLRLYKSVSEILTGFDVDSSCFAFDGKQVYATPRGIVSFCSQTNMIDLTRRSPSYESRLSKYARRGFEVYYPDLDRKRVDPTIFERSFARTVGLSRLLVLERLPKENDRNLYLEQRRNELGRPVVNLPARNRYRRLKDNLKDVDREDVAEWDVDNDPSDVSNYHTFTVPYGPRYNAKKIERLLYVKDLLLNAEWNVKKDRTVNLHRHPCFIGDTASIIHDCCGTCPEPTTDEEKTIAVEESKIYVSGDIKFLKDDPGRQAIGSFNPITDRDWTEMAYVGNTERLCQAICDGELHIVREWCSQEGVDVNRRDHTGRTPLHLAARCGNLEIMSCLIDSGARIVARLADGFTALHICAAAGRADMVQILLEKSEANEQTEAEKEDRAKAAKRSVSTNRHGHAEAIRKDDESFEGDIDGDAEDVTSRSEVMTEGSFVKVNPETVDGDIVLDESELGPDVYDVNVVAWDSPVSPLHLAILWGHEQVIRTLVEKFGADVLLPVKIKSVGCSDKSSRGAILNLSLAAKILDSLTAGNIAKTLLSLGSKSSQADNETISALHAVVMLGKIEVLKAMFEYDIPSASAALNHVVVQGRRYGPTVSNALGSAVETGDESLVRFLLEAGAKPSILFEDFVRAYLRAAEAHSWSQRSPISNAGVKEQFDSINQPVVQAVHNDFPVAVALLLEHGASVNTLDGAGHKILRDPKASNNIWGKTLLDMVNDKIQGLKTQTGDCFVPGPPVLESKLQRVRDVYPGPYPETQDLAENARYLRAAYPGSYEHWQISKSMEIADGMQAVWQQERVEFMKKENDSEPARANKEAIRILIAKFESLKDVIIAKGGKEFYELYPGIEKCATPNNNRYYGLQDDATFEFNVSFEIADLTDRKREAYLKLFQAVYEGDENTVKEMTMKPFKIGENNTTVPPLQIAIQDDFKLSPLSIAIGRGHLQLARTILEIASAQYKPLTKETLRYAIANDGSDEENDGNGDMDDNHVAITAELVNEQTTIDDVAGLCVVSDSKISASDMLLWPAPMWMFSEKAEETKKALGRRNHMYFSSGGFDFEKRFNAAVLRARTFHQSPLLINAIEQNDLSRVQFLLEIAEDVGLPEVKENGKSRSLEGPYTLLYALGKGYTNIAAELITRTGTPLTLNDLVDDAGLQEVERPKYYQGLKVYGQHKMAWAKIASKAHNGASGQRPDPLLVSLCRNGDLAGVEWVLSDTPLRLFRQYESSHQHEKLVQALSKGKGGFEGAVVKWLESGRDLAIHCAVLGSETKDYVSLIKYLCEVIPESLEKKSLSGHTPLAIAFSLGRVEAAKALIDAGADQTVRDTLGRNILHLALRGMDVKGKEVDKTRELVGLVDQRLLKDLFFERCSQAPSGMTPLVYWLLPSHKDTEPEVLDLILEHVPLEVLSMYDGSGQTPLHVCVRSGFVTYSSMLLQKQPALAVLENAMGQTPVELAETLYVRNATEQPITRACSHTMTATMDGSKEARVLELLRRFAAEHPGLKRKPVSMLQATEVAKRLAERKGGDKVKMRLSHVRRYRMRLSHVRRYRITRRKDMEDEEEEEAVEDVVLTSYPGNVIY